MSNIDDLKAKVKSLNDKLTEATRALNAALVEAHPFKVGDVGFHRSEEVMISAVFVKYGSVYMKARRKTKSGWHATETDIWNTFTPKEPQ